MRSRPLSLLAAAAAVAAWLGPDRPASAETPSAILTLKAPIHFTRSEPEVREAYIVSFGLYGGESVFESEARGAAQILTERLPRAQSLVTYNTKQGGGATVRGLSAALNAAGAAMDPDEDVLVVALTSHGTPKGLAVMAGRRSGLISPRKLRDMLAASGARYRVVIISACYSGIFAPVLASPSTLVITAAAADRPSFGCEDGATWTYFGDAFYNRAMRRHSRLDVAFAEAKRLVTERERREGFEPSLPQIAGGGLVLRRIAAEH
jgi:Peptidase C13 family